MREVREVSEEKMKLILEAMQGMTYLEWRKLSHVINEKFSAEAGKQSNKIVIASPDEIMSSSEYKFSF